MKKILIILLLLFSYTASSQCVSNQSSNIVPAGPYTPGQVVTVNYTLGTFTQLNINWIIAFQINLGAGWTNLTPITAPGNPVGSAWILVMGYSKHISKRLKLRARMEIR